MIKVIGPKSKNKIGAINTTSSSKNWSRGLSPFFLGPVELYNGTKAKNLENSYQFCKVYKNMADADGNPTPVYWAWARKGWNDTYAHRYPAGKGAIPLYSLWDGQKLSYIEARKKIYMPLYIKAVKDTPAYKQLEKEYEEKKEIVLFDFDGYEETIDSIETIKRILNDPKKKMGHGFVLAFMLFLGKDFDLSLILD